MKCLVTGSSGYIGTRLVTELQFRGHSVTGIDRREPSTVFPDRFIMADLLDDWALDGALTGVECVIHLAAAKDDWGLTEEEYFRDNCQATQRLLEAGRRHGIKDWVFYSTVAVLGASSEPLDESAPYMPGNPYGASKAAAEGLFHSFGSEDPEARILIIRPSAVYGPGNPPNNNIFRLINAIHARRFVSIGDGGALKTTSHLDNLITATFFAMNRLACGVQTYNYVDEPVLTTDELVRRIYMHLEQKAPPWTIPLWLAWPIAHISDVLAAVLKKDLPITAARIQKFCTSTNFNSSAIRKLGFRQPVTNEEALEHTVKWYLGARG